MSHQEKDGIDWTCLSVSQQHERKKILEKGNVNEKRLRKKYLYEKRGKKKKE
jgi:hypothetical protein